MKNSVRYLVAIFFLASLANFCFSQDVEKSSYFDYFKEAIVDDANQIFHVGLGLVQAPFHLNKNELVYSAATGLATGSLFLIDPLVKEVALRNQTAQNDKIFKIDTYFNGSTGKYAGTGLYVGGLLFQQQEIRRMGLHALEALFISSSITGFLKYSFGRRRPFGGDDQMSFKAFRGSRGRFRAFPSGHTTSAFAFASVMAMSFENIYWQSAWYGAAAMVGMARIYHNVHWVSDTFLAAVISYNVADFVVHHKSDDNEGFSFYPSINGFTVSISF